MKCLTGIDGYTSGLCSPRSNFTEKFVPAFVGQRNFAGKPIHFHNLGERAIKKTIGYMPMGFRVGNPHWLSTGKGTTDQITEYPPIRGSLCLGRRNRRLDGTQFLIPFKFRNANQNSDRIPILLQNNWLVDLDRYSVYLYWHRFCIHQYLLAKHHHLYG